VSAQATTTRWRADRHRRRYPAGLTPLGAAALFALASALVTTPARAYVQYQVVKNGAATGVFFHWKQTCIPVVVYPNDLSNEMTADEIEGAASAAAGAWSSGQLSCTFLDIKVTASFDPTRAAGKDSYNVLVFKNPWCEPGQDTPCQPDALAVTSVWAGTSTGTIQGADIEVNAENVVWADFDTHPGQGKQDLQNALTHEMGHLIGLDHNCYTPTSDPLHMTDNAGMLVPLCATAPADVQDDTMYTKADSGDLTKRTLAPDDIQAVCDIYPAAQDPHICPAVGEVVPSSGGGGGCSCMIDPSLDAPTTTWLPALALLLSIATRRRRR
jgi:hypothetical protein